MKKFTAFIVAFSLLFLSGCMEKDLIDIYIFADRFAKYSENFEIDTDNLVAKEENEILKFPLVFSNKFLLTVNVNTKTSLITDFSVTYMFDKKREITDKNFSSFLEIAYSAAKAFTNFDNNEDVFSNLSLKIKSDVLKDNHVSFEKGFYTFSFVSNEVGFYFSASTERR